MTVPAFTPGEGGGTSGKPKPEKSTWPNSPYHDFGNPPPPPAPEPGDSDGWLPSYFDPPVPSESRPEDTPGNGGSGSSKVDESWLPPYIPDHPSQTEQSTGQGSSSGSGKQSSTGFSETEDSPDADCGKDEAGAQDELPDIGEVQDDFGKSWVFDGISPDHWHHYNNPDAIDVQQDMEWRPLTFERCFEQAESPRSALEFIYANCPVTDESELRHLEQVAKDQSYIRAGIAEAGTGEARNDVQETFTLDDVRQFTEIDRANAALDEDEAERYELMLEKVFEYDIEWGTKKANKLTQLQNLAKANMHIVNYFAVEEGFKLGEKKALEEIKKHFSETDQGKLQVRLGANDETKGASLGRVPLPESTEMNLDTIFLGSQVDIPTIVHEFGHVMDRNINMTAYLEGELGDGKFRLMKADDKSGVNLNSDILYYVIEGIVPKQFFGRELLADLFMTAVLSGEGYKVKSLNDPTYNEAREITYDPIAIFATFNDPDGPTFVCGADAPCFTRNVEWESTNNARVVRAFLPKVFLHARSERERK